MPIATGLSDSNLGKCKVRIRVYNKSGRLKRDEFLGETSLSLLNLPDNEMHKQWNDLTPKSGIEVNYSNFLLHLTQLELIEGYRKYHGYFFKESFLISFIEEIGFKFLEKSNFSCTFKDLWHKNLLSNDS